MSLSKILLLLGALIFAAGLIVAAGQRFGLGRLPGDLQLRSGNTSIYLPIVTSIVLSLVLTIVLNVLLRWFR